MSFHRRRRPHDEESENGHERWLVSYADFITLMFAFFAVLYATSEKDLAKSQEFQESIKRFLIKAGAFGESGQQINQGTQNNTPIEPPIQTFAQNKPENARAADQAEAFIESRLTPDERGKYIVDVTTDEWGVRITLSGQNIFASGSDRFQADALPFLNKFSGLIAQSQRRVLIEGHVRAGESGGSRSTWDFASSRAVNMLRFVQKKENLPANQMAAASFADTRPIFTGDKAPQNSRLEVVLLNQEMEF